MTDELDGMATFLAVAEASGFRAAGERLGMSHSAVSQTLRRLETRLGVPLVRRSTRSVHLTEAGERLYASLRPAIDDVRAAMVAVGEFGNEPRGTLRVHMSSAALTMVGESLIAGFLTSHPHVQLDLVVNEAPVDIVAEGYDAGIQLGEVIDKDMIAVPVSGDLEMAVVGAPSYFARRGCAGGVRRSQSPRCVLSHAPRGREIAPDAYHLLTTAQTPRQAVDGASVDVTTSQRITTIGTAGFDRIVASRRRRDDGKNSAGTTKPPTVRPGASRDGGI